MGINLSGGQSQCTGLATVTQRLVYNCEINGGDTSTSPGVADRLFLAPWTCQYTMTIDQVSINVTTAVASALARVAIYASDNLGQPTVPLFTGANLDCSTTGIKTDTASLTFVRGVRYWLGVHHSSTATLSAHQKYTTESLPYGSAFVTAQLKTLRRTLTWGTALPNPFVFNVSEVNANLAYAIGLRQV